MAAQTGTVVVHGWRELNRALARADKQVRADVRGVMLDMGRPVADRAESLAVSGISRVGMQWSRMRVGSTSKAVYVVPKQRGRRSRTNPNLRRPNMGRLLLERSLQPTEAEMSGQFEREMEKALDKIADRFNKGL